MDKRREAVVQLQESGAYRTTIEEADGRVIVVSKTTGKTGGLTGLSVRVTIPKHAGSRKGLSNDP